MVAISYFLLLSAVAACTAQRPFYAGFRPIGYPELVNKTEVVPARFGNGPLPPIVRGDVGLINRLERLPEDRRPFSYINWKQIEELKKNPQSYPHRPSVFAGNQKEIH